MSGKLFHDSQNFIHAIVIDTRALDGPPGRWMVRIKLNTIFLTLQMYLKSEKNAKSGTWRFLPRLKS
jgi:hypothetical protein